MIASLRWHPGLSRLTTLGLLLAGLGAGIAQGADSDLAGERRPRDIRPVQLSATTSWLGCTFPETGGVVRTNSFDDGKVLDWYRSPWIEQEIRSLTVLSDGTLVANGYQEGGPYRMLFRGGETVGVMSNPGASANCYQFAADERFFYFLTQVRGGDRKPDTAVGAPSQESDKTPSTGRAWYGVFRYSRSMLLHAPWDNGRGVYRALLVLSDEERTVPFPYSGIALGGPPDARRLYVSSTAGGGQIVTIDPATMGVLSTTPCKVQGMSAIAADRRGDLWVTSQVAGKAAQLQRISPGAATPAYSLTLPADLVPASLVIDAQDRLLIADGGPAQQVRIYTGIAGTPMLSTTFGTASTAGPVTACGNVGPGRFAGLTCATADASGNIYVGANGFSRNTGFGGVLEAYDPAGMRRWSLQGLIFQDIPERDPADERLVYTPQELFEFDDDLPTGSQWTYRAHTVDRWKFPDDPRLHYGDAGRFHDRMNVWARRIDGKLFLIMCGQGADTVATYRFDAAKHGNIAIPCGLFAPAGLALKPESGYLRHAPAQGSWYWCDDNGNGAMDAGEFRTRTWSYAGSSKDKPQGDTLAYPRNQGADIDRDGGLWLSHDEGWWSGVTYLPATITPSGALDYPFAKAQRWKEPKPFYRCCRVLYDGAHDTLYLSGLRTGGQAGNSGGMAGTSLARFDQWLAKDGKVEPTWVIDLGYDPGSRQRHFTNEAVFSVATAGDYLFLGTMLDGEATIRVHQTSDGRRVGELRAGFQVSTEGLPLAESVGFIDSQHHLRVHRRANGDYVIFQGENLRGKVIVTTWRAGGTALSAPADLRADHADDGAVRLSWSASEGATAYHIERQVHDSITGWGSWAPLTSTTAGTMWSDTTLPLGRQAMYRVRAASAVPSDWSSSVRASRLGSLGSGWTACDLGAPPRSGVLLFDREPQRLDLIASGAGLRAEGDAGLFLYRRPMSDDGELVVRITSFIPADPVKSRCGLALRTSTDASAETVWLACTPSAEGKVEFAGRQAAGTAKPQTLDILAPCWLKLTRRGGMVSAAVSLDAIAWRDFPQSLPFPSGPALIGIIATSGRESLPIRASVEGLVGLTKP